MKGREGGERLKGVEDRGERDGRRVRGGRDKEEEEGGQKGIIVTYDVTSYLH